MYKMQGPHKPLHELMSRMQMWIDAWDVAQQDLVTEDEPFDITSYHVYLQWYVPRTRTRLVSMRHREDEGMVPEHCFTLLMQAELFTMRYMFNILTLLLNSMTIVHEITYTSYHMHRLT